MNAGTTMSRAVHLTALILPLLFPSPFSGAMAADLRLIDAAVLNRELSRWVVLDARPKAEWEAGHIQGSRSFSWENHTRTDARGVEFRAFSPRELSAALAGLGIDETSPVVVYGDADKSWGGEGWDVWVLSRLGHKGPVRLLNGGIRAWSGLRLPLAEGAQISTHRKERYQVDLKTGLDISTGELERIRGSVTVVDVRSFLERLKGRIPGSVHIGWEEFYTGNDRHPISSNELKKLLSRHGIDTTRPVVYYCTGGIRSAYAWMVHELAGLPPARNYEGGMAAWKTREARR